MKKDGCGLEIAMEQEAPTSRATRKKNELMAIDVSCSARDIYKRRIVKLCHFNMNH
jgi:hypothetical protein